MTALLIVTLFGISTLAAACACVLGIAKGTRRSIWMGLAIALAVFALFWYAAGIAATASLRNYAVELLVSLAVTTVLPTLIALSGRSRGPVQESEREPRRWPSVVGALVVWAALVIGVGGFVGCNLDAPCR